MGIHDVDRAPLLVGVALEDVSYVRSDQRCEYDQWNGHEIAEMVLLRAGGEPFTVWISEGVVDELAIAGEVDEVFGSSPPPLTMPSAGRSPWKEVVGSTITRVRTATTAAGEPEPHASFTPLTQALELTFENGRAITLCGYRPGLGVRTTWFDNVVVLDGSLEDLEAFDSRTVTVHR